MTARDSVIRIHGNARYTHQAGRRVFDVKPLEHHEPPRDGLVPLYIEEQGLCNEIGSEPFFSDDLSDISRAKKICHRCPVEADCLEWAIEHKEHNGVWGGTSAGVRRRLIIKRHGGTHPWVAEASRERERGRKLDLEPVA